MFANFFCVFLQTKVRLSKELALRRGLIDGSLMARLTSDDMKLFINPETKEKCSYDSLLGRCPDDPRARLRVISLNLTVVPLHKLFEAEVDATPKRFILFFFCISRSPLLGLTRKSTGLMCSSTLF